MPWFLVTIQSCVPRYYDGAVRVEAPTKEAAEAEGRRLYDLDEVDWDGDSTDWDGAEITRLDAQPTTEED